MLSEAFFRLLLHGLVLKEPLRLSLIHISLAEFFRERFSKELKRTTQGFTEETKQRMLAYRWPGNAVSYTHLFHP